MKRFVLFLLFTFILISCSTKKDQYVINGTVKGIDTGKVFLQKYDSEKWVNIDSTLLQKGEFNFKGTIQIPEMWQIVMDEKKVVVPVFVENSQIDVSIFPDSLDKSIIKGSASQDKYQEYITSREVIDQKMEDVYNEWKKAKEAGDSIIMNRADSISNVLDGEMKALLQNFVKTNPDDCCKPVSCNAKQWQFELPELGGNCPGLDASINSSQCIPNY